MTESRTYGSEAGSIKDAVVNACDGARDVFAPVMDAVSSAITGALRAPGKQGTQTVSTVEAVTDVASGAVQGALEAGGDLAHATKGITVGILRGTRETGETALNTLAYTARTVVHGTARLGGDLAAAARGVVQGAIHSARDLAVDAATAAGSAAHGALDASEEVGSTAAEKVRAALQATIDGVKVTLRRPFQDRVGGSMAATGYFGGNAIEATYRADMTTCITSARRTLAALNRTLTDEESHPSSFRIDGRQKNASPVRIRIEKLDDVRTRVTFIAGNEKTEENKVFAQRTKEEFETTTRPEKASS